MASLQKRTEKLTMVGMKFSLMMMDRICFQSVVLSPSSRQMDSSASFTAAGGLAIERTSTRCCFFIDFTADQCQKGDEILLTIQNQSSNTRNFCNIVQLHVKS
uniref:Uncharacterized protein n=1 Tax=Cairina moschata TaxID=8855 RepID=A0A8C3B9F0_CAIMO